MKVVVVGAGVIGASIAYQLGRAGADVTVVDAGMPAASSTSFGWINASFYADAAHHQLRVEGMAAYGRLMEDIADLPIQMHGALWFEAQGAALETMHRDLTALGYPVERVSGTIETDVRGLPDDMLRFPAEGAAQAAALAARLLRASGARVLSGVYVREVIETAGRAKGVLTSVGEVRADSVVIAAGTGTTGLLASVGGKMPMLTRPGVLVTTKPVGARVTSILVTPNGEVRQLPDGRILASAVANHQGDAASTVNEPPEDIAARVLGWLQPMFDEPMDWDQVGMAYRPMPQDGLPAIGAIGGAIGPDGLYVAVMHSGVTLAAITGEAVAAEVMGQGGYDRMLAPYRPQRFQ